MQVNKAETKRYIKKMGRDKLKPFKQLIVISINVLDAVISKLKDIKR